MAEALAGKRALATGASLGIGAATARLLAEAGAEVLATGRNAAALPGGWAMAGDLTCAAFRAEDVACAILAAVTARAGASVDLIELRPVGQS